MNTKQIYKLIQDGENQKVDFKQTITSQLKIAKTMVSFANTDGGTILIGVKDNKKISGIEAEEEIYMIQGASNLYTKPEVSFTCIVHEMEGKTVVEVNIPKSIIKPHYAKGDDDKWWAYVRVNDNSVLASAIVVEVLKRETANEDTLIEFTSIEKALLEYLNTIKNKITLKEYCKLVNISHRRAKRIIINLIYAGIIRAHTTEKEEFYTL